MLRNAIYLRRYTACSRLLGSLVSKFNYYWYSVYSRYRGYCPQLKYECGHTYGIATDKLTTVSKYSKLKDYFKQSSLNFTKQKKQLNGLYGHFILNEYLLDKYFLLTPEPVYDHTYTKKVSAVPLFHWRSKPQGRNFEGTLASECWGKNAYLA